MSPPISIQCPKSQYFVTATNLLLTYTVYGLVKENSRDVYNPRGAGGVGQGNGKGVILEGHGFLNSVRNNY